MWSIRPTDSCEEVGGYRRCFVSVKISRAWGGDGLLANRGGGRLLSKIYFPQHFNQTNHKHQALVISFDASHLFHLQKVPSNARDTTVRWVYRVVVRFPNCHEVGWGTWLIGWRLPPLSDNNAVDKVSVFVLNNVFVFVFVFVFVWVCLFSTMWSKLCTVSIIHSPHCELTLIARLRDKHKYQTSPESSCVVCSCPSTNMTVNTDVWSFGYKFRSPSKFYEVGQQLMFMF